MDFLPFRLRDETWFNVWQTIYTIALVITVVATIFISMFASRLTKKMQHEIAQSNETAAKSNAIAANAKQRTEEIQAENLGIKAENLKLAIRWEEERKARLELERRLADRFLTSDQERIISNAIRPHVGQKISVAIVKTDEAKSYGDQLIKLLGDSKWVVSLYYEGFASPPPSGIILRISPQASTAVQSLISAFEKAGIKPMLLKYPSQSADSVQLIVGAKPTP